MTTATATYCECGNRIYKEGAVWVDDNGRVVCDTVWLHQPRKRR